MGCGSEWQESYHRPSRLGMASLRARGGPAEGKSPFRMRDHEESVRPYAGQIAKAMLADGTKMESLYGSGRFSRFADVTTWRACCGTPPLHQREIHRAGRAATRATIRCSQNPFDRSRIACRSRLFGQGQTEVPSSPPPDQRPCGPYRSPVCRRISDPGILSCWQGALQCSSRCSARHACRRSQG